MKKSTGLVLVAVVASSVPLGMRWLADPYRFPLSVVEVRGEFRFLENVRIDSKGGDPLPVRGDARFMKHTCTALVAEEKVRCSVRR